MRLFEKRAKKECKINFENQKGRQKNNLKTFHQRTKAESKIDDGISFDDSVGKKAEKGFEVTVKM